MSQFSNSPFITTNTEGNSLTNKLSVTWLVHLTFNCFYSCSPEIPLFFFFFYTCAYKDYFVTSQLQYGPINILTSSSCLVLSCKKQNISDTNLEADSFRGISSCHKSKTLCNGYRQMSLSNVRKRSGFEQLCFEQQRSKWILGTDQLQWDDF